jgi:hypothetical protein
MAYFYAQQSYDTVAQVEAAITAFKSRLDNNPTDWATVKLLGGSEADGWIIPTETLTDTEINNISGDGLYSVAEVHGGNTYTGITSAEVTTKIAEIRASYAQWKMANTITETYPPSNEDMSGYV